MSSHSGFKKDKCWSCEHFSAHREYKSGIFLGDSVYTDTRGKCTNSRGSKYNQDVGEEDWCSKYQKWVVLQSAIAIEKQKEEAKRIMNEIEKERQRVEISKEVVKPLTPEEKRELEIRRLREEKESEERHKQEKIATQKDKINRINKSPITTGVISGILVAITFVLGWIPYWYWDFRREAYKRIVEDLYAKGRTIEDPFTYEMYLEGLHAKEMRNSVIWIPLAILAIGIVFTIIIVVRFNKTKPAKLEAAQKQLNELQK